MSNNNVPLVSILMPAYNHEQFVEEAVRSVLAQTYPNIELVVLDDGSKDNTYKILQSLQRECDQKLTRFILNTQTNAGTATTFNRLLKQATGRYILFLASDDELLPECLSVQVDFLEKHPHFVLNAINNEFIGPDGHRLERSYPMGTFYPLNTSSFNYKTFGEWLQATQPTIDFLSAQFGTYQSLLKDNYLPNGILFRKSALDKCAPLTKEAPLEDYFLNLQMAKQGPFHYIPQVLFRYRIHANNTMANTNKMIKMHELTQFYDWRLAQQDPNPLWKDIINQKLFYFTTIWKIGIWKIYLMKRQNYMLSQKLLCIGKKNFILRTRILHTFPSWWPSHVYYL